MSVALIVVLVVIVTALSAAVGWLGSHADSLRREVAALSSDIDTLWSEVFETEGDDPDPSVEDEPEENDNVVLLKGRAA